MTVRAQVPPRRPHRHGGAWVLTFSDRLDEHPTPAAPPPATDWTPSWWAHAATVLIKPITVRLIAYGEKANLAAIRTRAIDLLKDEHGKADPALLIELPGTEVHAEILSKRYDQDVELKKPTAKKPGLAITLPEMNEKMTVEWLHELPLAKTVVVFATWTSHRENMDWQLLANDGSRWSESRPHGG